MNLLHLEYFQKVAKLQSVSRAAEELQISQSALSMMMGKLEQELGYPLLKRAGRNIEITEYGRVVEYYSYILLNKMQDIPIEFGELQGSTIERPILVGVMDNNYYEDWILKLVETHPGLKIKILKMPREEICRKLVTGELDFGISNDIKSYYQNKISMLNKRLLFSQPYQLLVLHDHPLTARGKISVEELTREPLISLPPSYKERMIDILSDELRFQPNIVFEGDSEIMMEMFHARVGSILTCAHNLRQWMGLPEEQYAVLDIEGTSSRYEMYLLWPKYRYLSKWARIFQQYVFDYYHV